MNRTLIEALIRKTLKDMKDSPERSMRNLIDLGILFTDGRFKEEFLKRVQELLQDEQSAYYQLARDVIHHTEDEHLLTFGMNIGYEGCTGGAKIIRKIESAEGFDIPWSLYLKISDDNYHVRKAIYDATIKCGKKIGIHTYLIFSDLHHEKLLSLISKNKDCNFVLFCEPETVTDFTLDEMVGLPNLMFAIRYTETSDETANTCALLRERDMLYAVFVRYTDMDAARITEEYPWCDTEAMHSMITLIVPAAECSKSARESVYQTVYKARQAQRYATVPWDGYTDNCYIDSVISESACTAGFDENGFLYTADGCIRDDRFNLFKNELKDILKRVFPKKNQKEREVCKTNALADPQL